MVCADMHIFLNVKRPSKEPAGTAVRVKLQYNDPSSGEMRAAAFIDVWICTGLAAPVTTSLRRYTCPNGPSDVKKSKDKYSNVLLLGRSGLLKLKVGPDQEGDLYHLGLRRV